MPLAWERLRVHPVSKEHMPAVPVQLNAHSVPPVLNVRLVPLLQSFALQARPPRLAAANAPLVYPGFTKLLELNV